MSAVKVALQHAQKNGRRKTSEAMSVEVSPDSKCPICLDGFHNVSYLDRCLHKFCFRCILEWSKNKAECPLCKQPFNTIYHSIKSEQDFQKYELKQQVENSSFGYFEGVRFRYRTTLTGVHRQMRGRTSPPPDNGVMFEASAHPPFQRQDRYIRRMMARLAARRRAESEGRTVNNVREQEMIGIIGGSGLDDPDILEGRTERYVDTPYGKPSDALILGKIKNVECVLLARHGRQHTIMPSNVNYRANIWALREEGCTHLLVTTACGSLREEIQPGDIVIIDQFIDRTTKRHQTLYDGQPSSPPGVCHIPMAEPFCSRTREVLVEVARSLGVKCHHRGTMLTIEGPRFSSRAESLMFRQWGADVINMTTVPEVVLAKEAGLCYASIAMATDYDCWKEHEEAVCVDNVLKTMKENANKASSILLTAIPHISQVDWTQTIRTLKSMAQSSVMLPKH
uniref:S-methyl-5'-thioadenosine phosphorylase n=1 Tax=Oryzias latipes TaxID=8090 RepID=A0A3P9MNI4_ORYLA